MRTKILILVLLAASVAIGTSATVGGRAPVPAEVASTPATDGGTARTTTSTEPPSRTTSPATAPAAGSAAGTAGAPPTRPAPPAPDGNRPDPVRAVVPGAGQAPTAAPVEPIGDLDDHRPVPAGLGLVSAPAPAGSPAHQGPTGLAVEPSCSHQCITRGVAYPRGFGAALTVETTVPARLFLSVVADLDGDGSYEDSHHEWTPAGVTEHTWALDHLQPGQTYHVMAAATDADEHTAYVWGEFTTLTTRDVIVVLGDGVVVGGPDDITETRWLLGLDGPLTNVTPGEQGILLHQDLPRHVDVDFWVLRRWEDDLCGAWVVEGAPPHGHDTGSCLTWSSTHLSSIDLDPIPGSTAWTEAVVEVVLQAPTGDGALPPGYGDPYAFSFQVPMTLHVTYS